MNPPTLTMPVAVPIRWAGLKVRAKSKPIMEPGPPMASTTTSAGQQPQRGAARVEQHRRPGCGGGGGDQEHHGGAPERVPGDEAADQRSGTDGRGHVEGHERGDGAGVQALRGNQERISPGHGEHRAAELDGEVAPQPQPWCPAAARHGTAEHRWRAGPCVDAWARGAGRQVLQQQQHQDDGDAGHPASVRKAGVQPAECRTKANGTTLKSCPSCPDMPVSWVSSGTRAGANQSGISRMTEMKVMASPAPTSTRPSTPAGNAVREGQLELARAPSAGRRRQSWPGSRTGPPARPPGSGARRRQGAAAR